MQCPGPLGFCSPVCLLDAMLCLCGVLGHLAPVHRCACSVRCFACAVSWATGLLFTGVPAPCVACVCGVLGHLAPFHRCARVVCCVACALSWATWLLFTGLHARCVALRVRCPGPLGSWSPMCPLGVLPVCAVSSATWLLFTGVPARRVVLRVRCPGPLGSFLPVCPLVVLYRLCGVLGHFAPVHRGARLVRCLACAVSWATWLLVTRVPTWFVVLRLRCPGPLCGVSARCVVLLVHYPGPLGSCSPVCPLGALLCVFSVLGYLAPVHCCACVVCYVACAVSWATWLLFTGLPARCVVFLVWCPGPLISCSPVCPLGALLCVCGVLGCLAPVHRCACLVRSFACAVSWATWLLFTGVPARCVACVCGVLGHLSPVHRCARSVRCFACAVSWATWLLFTGVPAWCVPLLVRCPGPLGSCSPVCPLDVLCCPCGVLGHLAPVHRCVRSMCCVLCAMSSATWLLFTGVPARCVALRVRCPGPLGSCSPVCLRGLLCCVCGVLGHLAPVHRCVRSVCCVACAVSWATWLLFTGVPARCVALLVRCPGQLGLCSPVCPLGVLSVCAVSSATWLLFTGAPARRVVLRVRCPGPLGSCSPVCPLDVLCRVCGVLGHLPPAHKCARLVRCFACAECWATWLLFTGVPARCVVCVCRVLGHLAPVHRCVRSLCCVVCAVFWATSLLFTGVPARCVVLHVRCPGLPGSCSPVCPLGVLCSLCGVLGHLASVHRCARPVCCVACAVSWATWLLFTSVPARCVVLCVRCPGPRGCCSPVCPLGVLCCVCGVLGHLAPVHRCARFVCCFACAVSWATWLLFTGVPARCVVCVCGVLRHLAPVHLCARSVCCLACAVSWATWLLFTGVPARCVALRVRCPGPLGSCSTVCPLGALLCACGVLGHLAPVHRCSRSVCCLCVQCPAPLGSCSPVCQLGVYCCECGVLGHLAPVHQCARSVCCVACAVSWATWLLFTDVPARCVVLRVQCPGPLGSRSPVCPLGVLSVCAVSWAPLLLVHKCARSVCCVPCAVSWATWLLFTGVPARCIALRVRSPGPLGSCSPVCPLGVLSVCAVSRATWLLYTGVPARCVVLRVRCPGPLRSCSTVCPLGVLFCVCGVLGHLAPVHQCARLVCCVACAVSLVNLAPVHRCACSVCCVACAVSWTTWLLFTGVPSRCVALRVRSPGPLGPRSPVCPLGVLSVCAVSWATWLLFTGVPARCVVLPVRCPGPLGSCSPVCLLGVFFCVCGVLGHLAPVHQCARLVCCVACAVLWATWLLFTGVPARCVVLRVRCPGPLGSCSPVCPPVGLCRACGVLGPLVSVHPCARSVGCVLCTVSWAAWLLLTRVLALCAVLWVARGLLLCGASLRGAHLSIQTAAVRSRQGLGTLRARTRPSGRRLSVAGRP